MSAIFPRGLLAAFPALADMVGTVCVFDVVRLDLGRATPYLRVVVEKDDTVAALGGVAIDSDSHKTVPFGSSESPLLSV